MSSVRIPKWVGWPLLAAWIYFVLSLLVQWSMFHPEKYPGGLWHLQDHFQAEDVWVTASDGVRIHGWKLRAQPEAEWVTLYLHGNAGNLTHRVDHMEAIPRVGSDLLIIDYRGYGKSEGKPTEEGIYRDADAAYEYLVEAGYRPDQVIVYGESLGTAAAVDLASRHECAGVVLEAPFPSAASVASRVLPVLGPLAARGRLETAKKLPLVKAPLLVIHGTRDQVIDYKLGQEVFEAASEPKQFWTVEGAHHSDIVEVAKEQYLARLREFLDQLRGQ
jgi:fermentation-respiration switch protein FrsA (DUF1100 family)